MAGTWGLLANKAPIGASTALLLTDGTVMVQEEAGKHWWRLRPDAHGDYVHGGWSPLSPMHNSRLYYASAVLADGRVFVAGGEDSDAGNELNAAEIYDPVWDSWTSIPVPAGWTNIGDAPCCVLPNGHVLLGSIFTTDTAIYDPVANVWHPAATKDDTSSEETWTLLPDETVLDAECGNHPKAEKYLAAANAWTTAGTVPVDLVQASSIEIGPAILLPDGRVFALGATGRTALYTPPPLASEPGTWAPGPDIPDDAMGRPMKAKDAPACLLPNGRVLCAVGPAGDGAGDWPQPTHFFEFDGTGFLPVPDPPDNGALVYRGRLLLLPTGQVLYTNGSSDVQVYTPDGGPDEDWKPEITQHPSFVRVKQTYTLHGRLLNGLSQAVSYGDDATNATNYPLVRIHNPASGRVWYCRTFDHSSMGVATGLSIQSTSFKVPFGVTPGINDLVVVANGISSDRVRVWIGPWRLAMPVSEEMVDVLVGSLADSPLWVLGPDGPVPVPGDPSANKVEERARHAHRAINVGLDTLRELGREVIEHRVAAAATAVATTLDRQPSGTRRRRAAGTGEEA